MFSKQHSRTLNIWTLELLSCNRIDGYLRLLLSHSQTCKGHENLYLEFVVVGFNPYNSWYCKTKQYSYRPKYWTRRCNWGTPRARINAPGGPARVQQALSLSPRPLRMDSPSSEGGEPQRQEPELVQIDPKRCAKLTGIRRRTTADIPIAPAPPSRSSLNR